MSLWRAHCEYRRTPLRTLRCSAWRKRGVTPRYQGVVEKCTFCVERIDQGLNPFCIDVCPERARFFGDLNDEDSDVSQLIRENPVETLHPELDTRPSVYYIPPNKEKKRGVRDWISFNKSSVDPI